MQEENSYVLGTDREEMLRLGFQHQVWASEARQGWKTAEFSKSQTILDLGCGPGFCSTELAHIVGKNGKVIAVDKSEVYTNHLRAVAKLEGLNIDVQTADYDSMKLSDSSIDGVYTRWGLAWIDNPEVIIGNIVKALVPGGAFVAHEYYDWSTLQTEPHMPALAKAISTNLEVFGSSGGNINIGKKLPSLFYDAGLEVISTRPMIKLGMPDDLVWNWPDSYLKIFIPKMVEMGKLTKDEGDAAVDDLNALSLIDGATIMTPLMCEVIAIKP